MRFYFHFFLILSFLFTVNANCSTTITNRPGGENPVAPKGIPWVETRQYDVYVFVGIGNNDTDAKQLSYSRNNLLDKVNDKVLDTNRPKWETNYRAGPFASGSLELDFHEAGNLKKLLTTSKTGTAKFSEASKAAAKVPEDLDKKGLEELKREKERLEVEKAIKDLRGEGD